MAGAVLVHVQINTAVDEVAGFAEANYKLMASLRGPSARLAPADRKKATELMHAFAVSA